jgi:hypothetical protein
MIQPRGAINEIAGVEKIERSVFFHLADNYFDLINLTK